MEGKPAAVSCRDWCCASGFRKFICDGLLRGNSSCDAVFILQLVAVDEAGKSTHLAEVCGFTKLDVKIVSEEGGCPSLEVTGGECRDVLFDPKMDSSDILPVDNVKCRLRRKLRNFFHRKH